MPFVEFVIEIFGIGVARIYLFGMFPVEVVELDLYKIPLVIVMAVRPGVLP